MVGGRGVQLARRGVQLVRRGVQLGARAGTVPTSVVMQQVQVERVQGEESSPRARELGSARRHRWPNPVQPTHHDATSQHTSLEHRCGHDNTANARTHERRYSRFTRHGGERTHTSSGTTFRFTSDLASLCFSQLSLTFLSRTRPAVGRCACFAARHASGTTGRSRLRWQI